MSNETYIQIEDLHKSFATDKRQTNEVLKGIGFSGAGKSTLARCINCLERPDSGKVIVDGVDILGLSKEALRQERRKIGMIFQTFNLFNSKTVYQNIALPLTIVKTPKREVDQRVRDAAELAHLSDKLDAYPGALSGGQEQRGGIARAIISNPDILLSDEATSALDP